MSDMSPQETQLLQIFLNQFTQARGVVKDPLADALITTAAAQQPDATYLLVQRALLMEQALNAAKAQIASLQNQIQLTPPVSPSFLDSANTWGNSANTVNRPVAKEMLPASAPNQAQLPPCAPIATTSFLSSGVGNVLSTVAATAAGVAGGAFLFQGIEHMMGHHQATNFFGQQSENSPLTAPVESTTINNYYASDTPTGDSSDNSDDDDSTV